MNLPLLVDSAGRLFPLDRQIAKGGEGGVFSIPNDVHQLAKVYDPPKPQHLEKLSAMIALSNPRLREVAAWPTGLLFHSRTKELAGFVMPRMIDCEPM